MRITKDMGFGTKAIHAGNKRNLYGSMGTPIVPAVTYEFDGIENKEDIIADLAQALDRVTAE
ncbi:MAG: hypothetical protein IKG76_04885 [Firmicutes bacterium]|nr:hypothetical protein [Bacillota bacterium]